MPDKVIDVLIIGGAPAGLSAALFAARRGLKTTIITKNIGGQLATTVDVENYTGISYIEGYRLAEIMAKQATTAGAQIMVATVDNITTTKDGFNVTTNQTKLLARSLILAYGKVPRSLDVPGESELLGKGVSYCAGCEIDEYVGKKVMIVGGGSSAFTAAKLAVTRAKEVWLVHRTDQFRAEQVLLDHVLPSSNLHLKTNTAVTAIHGQDRVERVTIESDKGKEEIACDAIFIEVGFAVNRDLMHGLVKLDQLNRVIIDNQQATSMPGIFAAGDITNTPYNQAIISAGDGAKAALAAWSYLNDNKPVTSDWGKVQ